MNFSFNRDEHKAAQRPATPPAPFVTPPMISSMVLSVAPSNASVAPSVARSVAPSIASERLSSPEDTWETLDLSSTEYARMRREVMQLISDLRSLGAETMMDLPSIVVIGGQSAGKSSLVEAVTGVTVPRDSGTCTRCPMECMMSSSATTWSCKIKLRFDYDSFGRSAVQPKEIPFGPTITNRDDMEIWLRRAQAAILNPDLVPEGFYRKTAEDLKNLNSIHSLKFSRNVVSIFIEDPNATDLSFVDLPGLIQNEDEDVVNLVKELTKSYINRPNTIILTTIPMTDDMQNQQSVKLARRADPDGRRTIGILTKPDLLGDGAVSARQLWVNVIEGHWYWLRHGYYCVRLPDDAQRSQGLSRVALQRMAEEYFETTSPWNQITDRGRFGIPAFVTDISALLVSHIKEAIPRLKQDVERLLACCLLDINTLPKPLEEDPQIEVLGRVNAFCDAFKGTVSGSKDKTLAQRNRALYTIFAQDVRRTSPDFRPFELPRRYFPMDALDSEFGFESEAQATPPVIHAKSKSLSQKSEKEVMGVYEVCRTIRESTGWELPGNVPYEAKTRLINQFTTLWSAPAEKCMTSINEVLDDVIQQLLKTHFGRFAILQNMISDLVRADVEEHKDRALTSVKKTLDLESLPIYSQNLDEFRDLREKWSIKYRKARRNSRDHWTSIPGEEPSSQTAVQPSGMLDGYEKLSAESQALSYLARAGYHGLTADDLVRLSPRDQFEDELVVMADVRAYFTIAYKRIIDHVPLKIHQTLHQALADKLSISLLHRLIVDAISTGNFADRMKELVSDDPAIEAKRTRLEATRTRLQEMRRKLNNFTA